MFVSLQSFQHCCSVRSLSFRLAKVGATTCACKVVPKTLHHLLNMRPSTEVPLRHCWYLCKRDRAASMSFFCSILAQTACLCLGDSCAAVASRSSSARRLVSHACRDLQCCSSILVACLCCAFSWLVKVTLSAGSPAARAQSVARHMSHACDTDLLNALCLGAYALCYHMHCGVHKRLCTSCSPQLCSVGIEVGLNAAVQNIPCSSQIGD